MHFLACHFARSEATITAVPYDLFATAGSARALPAVAQSICTTGEGFCQASGLKPPDGMQVVERQSF